MPNQEQITLMQSKAFETLIQHLDSKKGEVQNIELMQLAGFCRNCLAKWYKQAGEEIGVAIELETAKEHIYKMPYEEYKAKYQK